MLSIAAVPVEAKRLKVDDTWYSLFIGPTPSQKRWGMARVVKGSHSFTSHPRIYPWMEWIIPTSVVCLPSRSWCSLLIYGPGGILGWVGLVTTTVSKQSAEDRYVMEITVVSCSDRHALPGNWKRSKMNMSVEPTTSRAESRDANHWVTESPNCSDSFARWRHIRCGDRTLLWPFVCT